MTLHPLAVLIQAAKNPHLLALHEHDITWMVKNTVTCARCQADQALRDAAVALQERTAPP